VIERHRIAAVRRGKSGSAARPPRHHLRPQHADRRHGRQQPKAGQAIGGYVEATAGGRSQRRAFGRIEGAIDTPLVRDMALRVAGYYTKDGGYGKGLFNGYKFNTKEDYLVRATLDGDLTPTLNVTLIGEFSNLKHGQLLFVPLQVQPGARRYDLSIPGTATPNFDQVSLMRASGARYVNYCDCTDHFRSKARSASLQLRWEVSDEFTLRSITGYRQINQRSFLDSEGTQYPSNYTRNHIEQKQYSQEFLANIAPADSFSFLGGFFCSRNRDLTRVLYQPALITTQVPVRGVRLS
jgi:iron complex outermembrane receptor protein